MWNLFSFFFSIHDHSTFPMLSWLATSLLTLHVTRHPPTAGNKIPPPGISNCGIWMLFLLCFPSYRSNLHFSMFTLSLQNIFAGGYRGNEDGYEIPAGTDIFISVSWLCSKRLSLAKAHDSTCFFFIRFSLALAYIFFFFFSHFRFITFIGLHTSGTGLMSSSQRGS